MTPVNRKTEILENINRILEGIEMPKIEEDALRIMQSIFTELSHEEEIMINKYFASDMSKENNNSCQYPCFIGYNSTTIVIIKLDLQLVKKETKYIDTSNIKSISIKKRFLSKFMKIKINCLDGSNFVAEVASKLNYIPVQQENVEDFIEMFQIYNPT